MSTIILREEQKVLVDLLQKYKCLRMSQVKDILYYYYKKHNIKEKLDDYYYKMISFLINNNLIFVDSSKYAKIDNNIKPASHEQSIMAFWVYLTFLGEINLYENFPATFPSDIFFIKDQQQYEALYIPEGQEYVFNMLMSEYQQDVDKKIEEEVGFEINKKYVIGVDSEESIEKMKRYPIDKSCFKNVLFVIMTFDDPTERPNRKFVTF